MAKKIQINLTNRLYYTIIALITLGILIILAWGVIAIAPSIDTSKGYHESNQVSVDISGTE